jgi:hypothetical protein
MKLRDNMNQEINVIVVKRSDRKNLCLRDDDPIDGKRREKTSGTTSMKAALRAAGEWQAVRPADRGGPQFDVGSMGGWYPGSSR